MRGVTGEEMNAEIFRRQFSAASFFTVLFGLLGWIVTAVLVFYTLVLIFTPRQFCGYYLDCSHSYQVKMYWKYGQDTVAYESFNVKEAVEVLKKLNEQSTLLKIQQQRPKEL